MLGGSQSSPSSKSSSLSKTLVRPEPVRPKGAIPNPAMMPKEYDHDRMMGLLDGVSHCTPKDKTPTSRLDNNLKIFSPQIWTWFTTFPWISHVIWGGAILYPVLSWWPQQAYCVQGWQRPWQHVQRRNDSGTLNGKADHAGMGGLGSHLYPKPKPKPKSKPTPKLEYMAGTVSCAGWSTWTLQIAPFDMPGLQESLGEVQTSQRTCIARRIPGADTNTKHTIIPNSTLTVITMTIPGA